MAKRKPKIQTISADVPGYNGSGTYAIKMANSTPVVAMRISSDVIHPSCVGPDRSFKTNGGAAYAAAVEFARQNEGSEIVIAIGSCYEFSHLQPFK